jgi:hypothetical protein
MKTRKGQRRGQTTQKAPYAKISDKERPTPQENHQTSAAAKKQPSAPL